MTSTDKGLSLEQRLRVAGYAAPRIRTDGGRKIKVLHKDGTVTETSLRDVQDQLLRRLDIEISVEPGKEFENQKVCIGPSESVPCPNATPLTEAAKKLRNRLARKDYWRCRSCQGKKRIADMAPEQRSEFAEKVRAGLAALTPEQRSTRVRKWMAAMTPEQRSEVARKMRAGHAALTPEQRSEAAKKAAKTRRGEECA